jgi:transcriptional regulator with XRE-family HTH domain
VGILSNYLLPCNSKKCGLHKGQIVQCVQGTHRRCIGLEWYDRARRLMDAGGINAAELARRAGIHEKTIYKYLDGKVDQPRGDTLSRIARVLSVSDQYLRFGEPTSIVTELARVPLLRLADMTLRRLGMGKRWWRSQRGSCTTATLPFSLRRTREHRSFDLAR